MEEGKNKASYACDLHAHTTRSDGADTPQELIDHAVERGLKVLAITDHDIRPSKEICITETGMSVDAVAYAASKGVKLLRGIEISCETLVEDVHIVCFGCNWDAPFFEELEKNVVLSKVESYRKLTEALVHYGIYMTWEEVLDNGGNPVPEEKVQKKMIFELMARKGYTKDWSQAKLMVKNMARLQITRRKPDPVDIIRQVHALGGIAIMAHPYLVNEPVLSLGGMSSREDYIEYLIGTGLDGIEACYPYSKTSYGGTMSDYEIEAEVRKKYSNRVAIISGGSDYHADRKKGEKNPRELGECGITEEYFKSNKLLIGIIEQI